MVQESNDKPETQIVVEDKKQQKQIAKEAKASIFVETVEENMKSFTKKEIAGARRA